VLVSAVILDLDRLAVATAAGGARIGLVDARDPEAHDRADAEELLAAGVAEVLAGLGRHHLVQHGSTAGTEARRPFEARGARFELGQALVLR
jgi:hypothetical protein